MKNAKRIFITLTLLILTMCMSLSVSAAPKLSKKSLTMVKGQTEVLTVSGTSKKVTWDSSNRSIVGVTKQGKIKAKKNGTATITATVGSKKLTCKVTVKDKKTSNSSGRIEIDLSKVNPNDYLFYQVCKGPDDEDPYMYVSNAKNGWVWCKSDSSIALHGEMIKNGQPNERFTENFNGPRNTIFSKDNSYDIILTSGTGIIILYPESMVVKKTYESSYAGMSWYIYTFSDGVTARVPVIK